MNRLMVRTVSAGLALALGQSCFAQARTHHAVFAVTSGDEADWQMTMGNIKNLIAGLQPESVDVEVVAYAYGLPMLKRDSSMAAQIAALEEKHVHFVACENSMRVQHVEMKDLLPGSGSVPSGVVELVRKQEQGWAYIKGGR